MNSLFFVVILLFIDKWPDHISILVMIEAIYVAYNR